MRVRVMREMIPMARMVYIPVTGLPIKMITVLDPLTRMPVEVSRVVPDSAKVRMAAMNNMSAMDAVMDDSATMNEPAAAPVHAATAPVNAATVGTNVHNLRTGFTRHQGIGDGERQCEAGCHECSFQQMHIFFSCSEDFVSPKDLYCSASSKENVNNSGFLSVLLQKDFASRVWHKKNEKSPQITGLASSQAVFGRRKSAAGGPFSHVLLIVFAKSIEFESNRVTVAFSQRHLAIIQFDELGLHLMFSRRINKSTKAAFGRTG